MRFTVAVSGDSRGYVLEVYDGHFKLPDLGPIGTASLSGSLLLTIGMVEMRDIPSNQCRPSSRGNQFLRDSALKRGMFRQSNKNINEKIIIIFYQLHCLSAPEVRDAALNGGDGVLLGKQPTVTVAHLLTVGKYVLCFRYTICGPCHLL